MNQNPVNNLLHAECRHVQLLNFWKPFAKCVFSFATPLAFMIDIKLEIDSKIFL
jgi:hypothetical protein